MQPAVERFHFKITPETRPFHVFQAFVQFRKAKFKYWNLNRWSEEVGSCKATLTHIMQGKALPEGDLVERMLQSMQVDLQLKMALQELVTVYQAKMAARKSPSV